MAAHGANMQKHIFFRKGEHKFYLNKSDIDLAILLKLIIINRLKTQSTDITSNIFLFLEKYFNLNELIGLDKFTIKHCSTSAKYNAAFYFLNSSGAKTNPTHPLGLN